MLRAVTDPAAPADADLARESARSRGMLERTARMHLVQKLVSWILRARAAY
eukprot:SAG31_NODE_722_length_12572_cov_2.409124_1_plen_50_part_10